MSNLRVFDPGFGDNFESSLRRFFAPMKFETDTPELTMRMDISETDGGYQVKADLPGVRKEDINIRVDRNIVQIDAEVKREKDSKGEGGKLLRSERYYGSVSRTFSLAEDVDDTKVQAKYDGGVLTLELPKKASAATKKVVVQ